MMTYAIDATAQSPSHGGTTLRDRYDVRARDDILISSWSGMLVPRPATASGAGILVSQGTAVSCREGQIGILEHVLVDPDTDEVRALVIRSLSSPSGRVVVPATWVEAMAGDEIVLARRPDAG